MKDLIIIKMTAYPVYDYQSRWCFMKKLLPLWIKQWESSL